ncbi:MAG TPA: gamma-glutamyltransferase, partial [Actinomycetes bacterium]
MSPRIAVAAPNTASVQAALRMAVEGGGAVDAAVAATLVTMVTEPGIVSLAGGAYATVWPAGEPDAVTVDGYVAMPGLGRPIDAPDPVAREVRTDYGAGVTMTAGHASVAVPGALAG